MSRALECVLTAVWILGISSQTVHQPELDVHAVEGAAVTLSCSYDSSMSGDYIFWYKQEVNSLPDFILRNDQFGQGKKGEKYGERFHCSMDASARQALLHIERVKPSDSGVFYCALQPTGSYRLLFGGGIRLTVETWEDFEPSFYKLEASNLTACLATGFSQHNATEKPGKGHMFEESRPVRISDDSLYNQVALLTTAHNDTCKEGDSGPGQCHETLVPDEKVNLLSLAVLTLRLIFAKTLAINCVMTLGLWFGAPE
ncbi:uncharacterized protein LOC109518280 [Hippocampus comes]|uniref:uncharacterized protein LOC109518280 n=1 Tax=Hippocampus comes TaxID=109280 RepID=UPI00094E675B|nr:PREDICTED: uncharacterized protein LOC109518280 [Hippocampus comes]